MHPANPMNEMNHKVTFPSNEIEDGFTKNNAISSLEEFKQI